MTDHEKAGLRGPVRTCVEEFVYPAGKFLSTTEYSPDGKLLTTCYSNPDGSECVTTKTYDSDGRLVKTASGKSGEPSAESLYAYDKSGRLLTITNSTENGGRTNFRYDGQGRKTSIQTFDPKTIQRAQNTAFAGSPWDAAVGAGIGVPAGGKITTTYNENDQPTEAQILDAEGQIVSRIVRTYDANGQISEERAILENPLLMFLDRVPAERRSELTDARLAAMNAAMKSTLSGPSGTGTIYAYDAQGRITKIHDRSYAFDKVTTISYNDHGDKAEKRTAVTRNPGVEVGVVYSMEENGTVTKSQPAAEPPALPDLLNQSEFYAYQYDSYGNWTQQTLNYRSLPNEPSSVRNRKLAYY